VLHTVGPVGEGEDLLQSSYRTVLEIVKARDDIRTVALCGVSTGIFGFDLAIATRIALTEARTWLEQNHACVDKLIFCTFLPRELEMYEKMFPSFFPLA
jgi:O-acetyl-ADP-ribose deacetylase (regulator of RNase III)